MFTGASNSRRFTAAVLPVALRDLGNMAFQYAYSRTTLNVHFTFTPSCLLFLASPFSSSRVLLSPRKPRFLSSRFSPDTHRFGSYLDFRYIRDNLDEVLSNLRERKTKGDPKRVKTLYEAVVDLRSKRDQLRNQKNRISKDIGAGIFSAEEKERLIQDVKGLNIKLAEQEVQIRESEDELFELALQLPNRTHPDVPKGAYEHSRVVKSWQPDTHSSRDERGDHVAIGEKLDLFEFQQASKMSGHGFVYLQNEAALLELALVQWTMHKLYHKGFVNVLPPEMVHPNIVRACGFQPRGTQSQTYIVSRDGKPDDSILIGTSELALAAMHAGHLIEQGDLPHKLAAFSHCFRAESTSGAGVDVRGLYRLQQFSKVEMFVFCSPRDSDQMLNTLLGIQEEIVQDLELPYRVLDLSTEELGAPAYRKYDIEVFMPSRNGFGEVSSASNCTDYQSRRLGIRTRTDEGTVYVHTLNATACAVPRLLIALLENHYCKENDVVRIPEVLHQFLPSSLKGGISL